jgi:ATP-dependent Clp protease ATP-binding subunit ClpC
MLKIRHNWNELYHLPTPKGQSMPGPAPTPRYTQVISSAAKIAHDMGHDHLGVEHLFLAILRDGNSLPAKVLSEELDLSELDQKVLNQMRASYTQ